MNVSQTTVDNAIWDIRQKLWRRCSTSETERYIDPLVWYINTGRASVYLLRALVNATERQKTTIAKRLMKSTTTEAAIKSVREYLGV